MKISKDKLDIVSDAYCRGKLLFLILGSKYENKQIVEIIDQDFTKFKGQITRSLKQKQVDNADIRTILRMIRINYKEIYPDEIDSSENDVSVESGLDPNLSEITFEDWISRLIEKFDNLKTASQTCFPDIWPALEFTLSVKNILHLDGITLPFAGIILGQPSSSKTLSLELLRDLKITFYTDSFTPRSFVSHNTSVKKEQLHQIDMLPKIKNKLFLTPELGPLFSSKDEEMLQTLGILTRILDGHGYESDSGAFGHRGYNEDVMFSMIGASVEIPRKVYKHLATLGPKLYFFRIENSKKNTVDFLNELRENNFVERRERIKEFLLDYISWFELYPPEEQFETKSKISTNLIKIGWDKSKDDERALELIVKLGQLLAPLRGTTVTWETKETQGSDYAYGIPIVENPSRAITCLANLGKGHALLEGRNYLTLNDIPILAKVVLSTAPKERVMIFDLLLNMKGEINASQIMQCLDVSKPTALRTMTELRILGLVTLVKNSEWDNGLQTIRLKNEHTWVLEEEFKKLRIGLVVSDKTIYNENTESVKKNYPHVEQINHSISDSRNEKDLIKTSHSFFENFQDEGK